ncbi:thiol oxidoreductase [Xanthobacter dioxanivorans]|uniref:Thiol oxidoreductase n=1 Tax=Xanthobacter dioxanivorans TaxID=2528964 RepID=A0A974PKS6_9HYPH|nr:di-heme oxidoredictase family protein [Xanthobacter dioxanivorans]QRG04865.1 thiol oxidoreductase [Xanthobacter dioxanivorans]
MGKASLALVAALAVLALPAAGWAEETGAAPEMSGLDLAIGKSLFKRPWVPAPASTRAADGLGPLFDARSCASCHPRDGRAPATVENGTAGRGFVLMIARPDGSGDPVYGRRFQIDAVPGIPAEGMIGISDTARPDGRMARKPHAEGLAYGPIDPASGVSLRVAPDLKGRGALARVPDAALIAIEQEQAKGKDGVSGRARRITRADGTTVLGRFGWKASQPDLARQSAEAFFLDLGLSNPYHPEPWGDCTPAQTACRDAPHGTANRTEGTADDALEIGRPLLDRVVAYVASLPAPAPEPLASKTRRPGAHLFAATGCAACHRPSLPTTDGAGARMFTDLLLHDMGPDLGDTMPEPGAGASEWRTAPLAGLSAALAEGTGLLHDGRARSIEEAVAWHGGEAATAARRFGALSDPDKAALVRYLSGL